MAEATQQLTTSNPRLRRFFYAVVSGYTQLIANTIYTLASVPLALRYLPQKEFGLWALAIQLGGYLQLIDFGMSASISRHLIDHKDGREGSYGETVATGALVLSAQGALVMLGAAGVILFGTPLLRIDTELQREFQLVMLGQCAIIAADFPTRLFAHILIAHQRTHINNFFQTVWFLAAFVVQWLCFGDGFGIYSLLCANAAGWLIASAGNAIACQWLHLLPSRGQGRHLSWERFRELFQFGKDVFWVAVGSQLIVASQTIIVTRVLGLSAAATWSVCTRTYYLLSQLLWRVFDYSAPALAEMMARNECQRLYHRFKSLVILSCSLAALAATVLAVSNQSFVALWTQERIGWSVYNDVLIGVLLLILVLVHSLSGFLLTTKEIGSMRYTYLLEGVTFVVAATLIGAHMGFSGIISSSIVCSCLFTLPYATVRISRYFGIAVRELVLQWMIIPARLLLLLAPIGSLLFFTTRALPPAAGFIIRAASLSLIGAGLLLRVGLQDDVKNEFCARAPKVLRKAVKFAVGNT